LDDDLLTIHNDTMTHCSLSDFPEELLDRILSLSLLPSTLPPSPRPAWHPPSPARTRTRLAPLLVSHRFSRIGTPHLYHTIHLSSAPTTHLLLATLQSTAALGAHVRALTLGAVSPEGGAVLGLCPGVEQLEVVLDGMHGEGEDTAFIRGLQKLHAVRHLTLRKPGTVYLSLPRARIVIAGLAAALDGWPSLETADIAFKLSDDTPTSPVAGSTPVFASFPAPQRSQTLPLHAYPNSTDTSDSPPLPQGPITALTTALARAPNLHTFTTHLPSVWNVAILAVSTNPRLERIVLVDGRRGGVQFDAGYHFTSPASPVQTPAHTPFSPSLQAPKRGSPLQAPFNPRGTRLAINTNTAYTPGQCSPSSVPCHTFNTAHPYPQHQPPNPGYAGGIIGTGLFLMEARKHARLGELIRNGTVVVRGRAFTMGSPGK
jgi:hypothetical protein